LIGALLGGFVAGYYVKPKDVSDGFSMALLYSVFVTLISFMLVAVPILLGLAPLIAVKMLTLKSFYAGLARKFIMDAVIVLVAGSASNVLNPLFWRIEMDHLRREFDKLKASLAVVSPFMSSLLRRTRIVLTRQVPKMKVNAQYGLK